MGITVETTYGKIEGVLGEGISIFRGIPFAEPPVGKLRFQAPQKPKPWSGVRDATKFSPSAPQEPMLGMNVGPMSEDCLYLNVWTPASRPDDGKKRPVLFWIHGGGFMGGSGSQEMYEAAHLARSGDAVVVTTNYRIGALGFMFLGDAVPGIPSVANAGLLDQIAALEWTRDNIAKFGGDPSNITIFGESAGGMSVSVLLGLPKAKGLFHKAVPQSGATHHACTRADATRVAQKFLEEAGIGAGQTDKLYALTADQIREIQKRALRITINRDVKERLPLAGMVFVPVVDGSVLPEQPLEAIRGGLSGEIPVMTGTNLDEWAMFLLFTEMKLKNMDDAKLLEIVQKRLGNTTPEVAAQAVEVYRKNRPGAKPVDIYCAIESDRIFRIPAIRLVEAQSRRQKATYLYLFTWASPMMNGALKSCHALEIPFLFGNTDSGFGKLFTGGGEGTKPLSKAIQSTWHAFAKTGRPDNPAIPAWPAYDTGRRPTLELGEQIRVLDDPLSEERRFWDGIL